MAIVAKWGQISTIDKPGYYDMGFEALFNLSSFEI